MDRRRLTALLGMLGSDHDGEVANAGRAADRLVRASGTTWEQVVNPPVGAGAGDVPQEEHFNSGWDLIWHIVKITLPIWIVPFFLVTIWLNVYYLWVPLLPGLLFLKVRHDTRGMR